MGRFWQGISTACSWVTLGSLVTLMIPRVSEAQLLPTCAPPAAGEYLVLIFTTTPDAQTTVRREAGRGLSKAHGVQVCEYGGHVLSRVGGFESLDSATTWAEYVDTVVGLPLMVITPVDAATPRTTVINPMTPAPIITTPPPDIIVPTEVMPSVTIPPAIAMTEEQIPPFVPRSLTGGYGVLVDYGANPAIATQVKTLLGQEIGLVTYGSRGYLLVEQTTNPTRRTELLNLLSQNGLNAIAVPAEQLILLSPTTYP